MTVLEKIKRCVSLVWDFQEIYGGEYIEDFCRNELHTYPQYNEILDYFKRIEELEKENAELKEKLKCAEHNCKVKQEFNDNQFNAIIKLKDEFTKSLAYAKSIIKDLLDNSDEYAKQRAREFLEKE